MASFLGLSCLLLLASGPLRVQAAEPSEVLGALGAGIGHLSRRQTGLDPSDIPTGCQSSCSTIVASLNSCPSTSLDCLCTTANANGLESCVNCLVAMAPSASMISQGESILSDFESGCSSFNIPSLSVTATGTGIATGTRSGFSSASRSASAVASSISPVFTSPVSGDDDSDDDSSSESSNSDNPFAKDGAMSTVVSSAAVLLGVVAGAIAVL